MRRHLASAFALLCPLLLLACGGAAPGKAAAPAPAAKAAPPAPAPTAPTLRLPRTLLPEENRVSLVLDPAKSTFTGRIEIAARVAEPARVFWLSAEAVTVVLDYHGKIDDKETEGIFRQKDGEDWYLFTQFESMSARRAYPCFDEPDSKVPWQITLEVPENAVALSNTPVAAEDKTGHGTRRVTFVKTPPLPSYLVAFAVGPFEVVPAGHTRTGTPIRIVVPRGRGGEVGYVADTTAPILALLEDYFGTPYPFAKLDIMAIPQTVGFGAMENPGLVTFNQRLLVARRADFTI